MRAARLATLATLIAGTPAHALCFYAKADFYAGKARSYTTIPQEFRDSKWVVKARVETADYHWANSGDSWTVYGVRVLTRFKGPPSHVLRLFTFRDSGGFYLDNGTSPDLNSDYLLFLDPPSQTPPRGVRNVVEVNFSCGQSRAWSQVTATDQRLLSRLSRR
jgi:hypothetical protein